MENDGMLQFCTGYDEDDDDCDLDEFLEQLENEYESFEERLKRYSITLEELRKSYADFTAWYEKMLKRISAECDQKAIVCRALCRYIRENGFDDDIISLWCACESEHYDCVIAKGCDKDEQSILFNFLTLESDIKEFMRRIKTEEKIKAEYRSLADNIRFSDEYDSSINAQKLFHELSFKMNVHSPELEANLESVTEDICRSPQLRRLAPLVYYSLMTRQTSRMLNTAGYEPNYTAIFEKHTRCIDRDNGKNIGKILLNIEIYNFFKEQLDGLFDGYLCDMGFSEMSNITECSLVSFDGIIRPLYYQLRDEYFTAFPNGMSDNPVVVSADVHPDDISDYEYYDKKLPPKLRILEKLRRFIVENESFSEEYLSLIINGDTQNCMPVVLGIFCGAGVDSRALRPDIMDVVYAVIIDELQKHIDRNIQSEMLSMIEIFKGIG